MTLLQTTLENNDLTGAATETDTELVTRLERGDEAALGEVYRRHRGAIYGLALRLLRGREAAEEVLQEVMLRLWRQPEKFDSARGSLRSFLLAHTHGRSVDLIRSQTARRNREERDARLTAEAGLTLEEEVWEMALAEHIRDAVMALDAGERRAIELAYFGGYTYREVARLLDAPEGTVKSRIRAGLKRLNGHLTQAGLAPVT